MCSDAMEDDLLLFRPRGLALRGRLSLRVLGVSAVHPPTLPVSLPDPAGASPGCCVCCRAAADAASDAPLPCSQCARWAGRADMGLRSGEAAPVSRWPCPKPWPCTNPASRSPRGGLLLGRESRPARLVDDRRPTYLRFGDAACIDCTRSMPACWDESAGRFAVFPAAWLPPPAVEVTEMRSAAAGRVLVFGAAPSTSLLQVTDGVLSRRCTADVGLCRLIGLPAIPPLVADAGRADTGRPMRPPL